MNKIGWNENTGMRTAHFVLIITPQKEIISNCPSFKQLFVNLNVEFIVFFNC